tara:strand:- start:775 stop:4143 length:3369 start_codon:yes stop_codon:yes gene_type:complete
MPKISGLQWLLISAVSLFFFAGLALLLLIVFPNLVGLDSYKTYALDKIESQLGSALEVSNIYFTVFPKIQVGLEHITFLDPESRIPTLSADRLAFDLSLLPLLHKEIVVNRLELDHPRLNLHGKQLGHFGFSDFFPDENNDGAPMPNILMLSTKMKELIVRNGKISITQRSPSGGGSSLKIEQINLTTNALNDDPLLEFSMQGVLPHNNGQTKIHMTGTLSAEIMQSSPSISPQHEYTLTGTTHISSLDLTSLHPYIKINDDIKLDGLADFDGAVTISLSPTSHSLNVQDINLHWGTGNLTGSATFQKANTEPWSFQGEINTAPFDIQTALTVFSPHLNETMFYNAMTEAEISGNARIVQASISSALDMLDSSDISVSAELELKDIRGQLSGKTFEHINASIILEDDTLELRSLVGQYGKSNILRGIGIITDLYDKADIESTVTFMVPTSEFMDYLGRNSPRDNSPKEKTSEIWEYGSPAGGGHLTLEITGGLDSNDLDFEGVFQSRGMGFHSNWIGLPVSKLFGRLDFSSDGIDLTNLKGRIGRSRAQVTAHFSAGHSTVRLQSHADTKELTNLLLAKTDFAPLSSTSLVQGTALLNLTLDRHADATTISANLDLKKTGYRSESGISKPIGVAASADADVILQEKTQAKIQRLRFFLEPLLLTASGTIELTSPPQYSISMESNLVDLDKFHDQIPHVTIRGLHPESGLFKAKLKLTGVGTGKNKMEVDGQVSLLHGRISAPKKAKTNPPIIEDVNAIIQFSHKDDGRVKIKDFSATFNGSPVRVSGVIKRLHILPRINISIDASRFDIESMISQDSSSPFRELITSLIHTTTLQSDIHVDEVQYHDVVWTDMHLAATGMGGFITLEIIKAQSGDGNLQAHTTIHMPKNAPVQINGNARFKAVPAQDIVTLLGGNERLMFGHANLEGELTGNGGHEDGLSATLDGKIHLVLSNGRIRKFTALSKILNLLNLPQLLSGHVPDLSSKGLAFDSIKATLNIKKGAMTIENLAINSPIMKIGGVGHYDIPSNDMNIVVAVSPFGSYENILNKIPILNKIFAGGDQRRGILTTLFEVKGPLSNPEVTVMPGESMTSGLTGLGELAFDILRNTIFLPKELIVPTVPQP